MGQVVGQKHGARSKIKKYKRSRWLCHRTPDPDQIHDAMQQLKEYNHHQVSIQRTAGSNHDVGTTTGNGTTTTTTTASTTATASSSGRSSSSRTINQLSLDKSAGTATTTTATATAAAAATTTLATQLPTPYNDELPGGGQFYCIITGKHFISAVALQQHQKSRYYKRRYKEFQQESKYTQHNAEWAAGMTREQLPLLNHNNKIKDVIYDPKKSEKAPYIYSDNVHDYAMKLSIQSNNKKIMPVASRIYSGMLHVP
jgi:bud site selection protein 20